MTRRMLGVEQVHSARLVANSPRLGAVLFALRCSRIIFVHTHEAQTRVLNPVEEISNDEHRRSIFCHEHHSRRRPVRHR
jgi:hypothetical protein